ncbi:Uncharacterised protein [Mycobacteroides abscessus subsp. abscessus]|nr:Uncharacterised protein [Mycobacteroides abscessus subsp. abscessus]SHX11560.1 Uncharacterised protein [Mycobacteroides abscessus subsp. abscessus]
MIHRQPDTVLEVVRRQCRIDADGQGLLPDPATAEPRRNLLGRQAGAGQLYGTVQRPICLLVIRFRT